MNAADADAEDDADAVFVEGFEVPSGVFDGLLCSDERILREEVHLAYFFTVNEVCGFEVLHFAGELRFELGSVKVGDGSGTADAGLNVFPGFFSSVTNGGEGTQARHDNSF